MIGLLLLGSLLGAAYTVDENVRVQAPAIVNASLDTIVSQNICSVLNTKYGAGTCDAAKVSAIHFYRSKSGTWEMQATIKLSGTFSVP